MISEKKSIFDLADKFGYESPFDNWVEKDFGNRINNEKQRVQFYTYPDKKQYELQRDRAKNQYEATKAKYIEYYMKIGKLSNKSTEKEIQSAFSETNKKELERLDNLIKTNQGLLDEAIATEKQWNKLDIQIEDVVYDFNKRKDLQGENRLNPNLLKALMFSESEMGAGVDYKKLVENVPKHYPNAVYQLNLGRVTDADLYSSVVEEYSIPVDWRTSYKDMGNKNDVMLAAGALIKKMEYALKVKSSYFKSGLRWFNAVVAYKGVSLEGAKKAELAWKLFQTGAHPYTTGKKLF